MTKNEKATVGVLALVALWWWLQPKEVVTAGIRYEGLADEETE